MWNRLLLAVAVVAGIACASFSVPAAFAQQQTREDNVDRPGRDIRNFPVRPPAPNTFGNEVDSCRISCEQDGRCKAWTLVRAGLQGPQARCWLKNAIPAATPNGCCTSGVPVRSVEPNIDRPGADYRNMDLAAANSGLCKAACDGDGGQCRAWTYVRPGVQGPRARCWLKAAIPAAVTSNCCTSGVQAPIVR